MEVEEKEVVGGGSGREKEHCLGMQTFVLTDFRGGEGEFTTCVKTQEEGEEGVGSTGRKMMLVGFCFFGASFGTSESSSSESGSEGFKGIFVGGGGTS